MYSWPALLMHTRHKEEIGVPPRLEQRLHSQSHVFGKRRIANRNLALGSAQLGWWWRQSGRLRNGLFSGLLIRRVQPRVRGGRQPKWVGHSEFGGAVWREDDERCAAAGEPAYARRAEEEKVSAAGLAVAGRTRRAQ